ncbi:PREDICTED: probable RNA-dependent RNA polymerase 1 [Theobroma cacao]|uniref:RNA-dependent RNA polymerase n=1 Tax=Theobroma cacao TaxID=3641 RepID=A0AB32VLS7_THECC|nr:PREDICTED: probable RNA-dependent RNA polymerase 1 [Theobroma cacao]
MGKTIKLFGFATGVSQREVTEFLEEYIGKGAIEAVKVGQSRKEGSRAHAKVQFKTNEDADMVLAWTADQALWHNDSYLKAWTQKHNIIPTPKPQFHLNSIDNLTLHFGCQVSRQKFSVLWKKDEVSFKYGSKLDRLYFLLSYNSTDYKLELFDDSVWQIVLHSPLDQTKKFLIIQLLGAPRIYEKDLTILNSAKEVSEDDDDQWIRDVDFTPGHCIGQSFALCLELPRGVKLPKVDESFYYRKVEDNFILENGSSFSCNPDLVPMITPPEGFDLPYGVLFKVNSLVQHGCLLPPTLDADFYQLVDPRRIDIAFIERALEKAYSFKEYCYEPAKWLAEQYEKYRKLERPLRPPILPSNDGIVAVRRVQVTPSKVYFSGPELNLSNRVLRNYIKDIDNFLRVSFVDEELGKMHSTDLSSSASVTSDGKHNRIYDRILSTLIKGIVIGDKNFEFLACSTSQLRENSIWMFASKPGLTAVDIREKMGHFHVIRNVAKYAARLGQSLSSSRETLEVRMDEIKIIPDIEVETGEVKYCFSDGIGKISEKLAKEVALKCNLRIHTPSAFQIRYGGYKGVVAVDPTSSVKLSLRKSMQKFDADSTSLDVLSWSKRLPCYLNRQIIILMSTLGVKDSVFERKQKEVLNELDAILVDPERAREAMEWISHGELTNCLRGMLMCGYPPDSEPFLSMMLRTIRTSKLLDLRTKTRIFVPNGRIMIGCLDETGTLEYGQVFVQCSVSKRGQSSADSLLVVEGKVAVTKNPCLHPGDLRVLKAVDAVVLHHMVDCIVFPQKGNRPHPNECSGSDLDGDLYFVCWDEDLIPPCQFPPMHYGSASSSSLDHDVTIEEVAEYFTNYILNDSLGIISNAHIVFADKEPTKALSEPCIELAKLSSIAVDFPKTGVPAKIPHRLRVHEYPDFMDKPDKFTYESEGVIGKLYREVRALGTGESGAKQFTKKAAEQSYDSDMEVDGFEAYVNDAFHYKSEYDNKLSNLMRYYGIKTEAEMISGCIMKMSKSFDRRRDLETVVLAVKSLKNEVKGWFNKKESHELKPNERNLFAKASAWYHVTYHPSFWGRYNEGMDREQFISFPWCVYDKLLQIKENSSKKSLERTLNLGGLDSDQRTSLWDVCSFM